MRPQPARQPVQEHGRTGISETRKPIRAGQLNWDFLLFPMVFTGLTLPGRPRLNGRPSTLGLHEPESMTGTWGLPAPRDRRPRRVGTRPEPCPALLGTVE